MHQRLKRFNIWTCHRGFGKTYLGVHELLRVAAERDATEPVRLAYVTDLRINAKQKAWEPVVAPVLAQVPSLEADHSDLTLKFPRGSWIGFFGSREDVARMRGLHLDGVAFDEYALVPPTLWELVVLPALMRRNGGAIFMGTPMGRNHFHALYKAHEHDAEWACETIRASESSVFTAEQLALLRRNMTPEQYAQEYECSWDTPMQGAVYGAELVGARASARIRPFAHDASLPVETWWDLGATDATAILFTQSVDREIRCIDYVEDERKDLAHYARLLNGKPYTYARHHLPHDAGAERLEGGLKSIADQLRTLVGKDAAVAVHPAQSPLIGIHTARLLFPRIWFSTPACDRLLEALESYHYEWDRKRNIAKPEPDHDWASHGADAFRLMCTHWRRQLAQPQTAQRATPTGNPFTYARRHGATRAIGSLS